MQMVATSVNVSTDFITPTRTRLTVAATLTSVLPSRTFAARTQFATTVSARTTVDAKVLLAEADCSE